MIEDDHNTTKDIEQYKNLLDSKREFFKHSMGRETQSRYDFGRVNAVDKNTAKKFTSRPYGWKSMSIQMKSALANGEENKIRSEVDIEVLDNSISEKLTFPPDVVPHNFRLKDTIPSVFNEDNFNLKTRTKFSVNSADAVTSKRDATSKKFTSFNMAAATEVMSPALSSSDVTTKKSERFCNKLFSTKGSDGIGNVGKVTRKLTRTHSMAAFSKPSDEKVTLAVISHHQRAAAFNAEEEITEVFRDLSIARSRNYPRLYAEQPPVSSAAESAHSQGFKMENGSVAGDSDVTDGISEPSLSSPLGDNESEDSLSRAFSPSKPPQLIRMATQLDLDSKILDENVKDVDTMHYFDRPGGLDESLYFGAAAKKSFFAAFQRIMSHRTKHHPIGGRPKSPSKDCGNPHSQVTLNPIKNASTPLSEEEMQRLSLLSPRTRFINRFVNVFEKVPQPVIIRLDQESHSINLANMSLRDDYVILVSEVLNDLPRVTEVNVRGNMLTDRSMRVLVNVLSVQRRVTFLDLSENKIDSVTAEALAHMIHATSCPLRTLKMSKADLDDDEVGMFMESFGTNSSITTLDLSGNFLGETDKKVDFSKKDISPGQLIESDEDLRGGASIAKALTSNEYILKLNISWNRIGPVSAAHLGSAISLTQTLTSLNLSYNVVKDLGAEAIAAALTKNCSLTKLDLSNNDITVASCCLLGFALKENSHLKELNVSGNPIGTGGAMALIKSFNYQLISRDIILRGCAIRDTKGGFYDETFPFKTYELDMTRDRDKMIMREIYRRASLVRGCMLKSVVHKVIEGKSMKQSIITLKRPGNPAKYMGRPYGPWNGIKPTEKHPYTNLNADEWIRIVARLDLIDVSTGKPWVIPDQGTLTVEFEYHPRPATPIMCLNATGFLRLKRIIEKHRNAATDILKICGMCCVLESFQLSELISFSKESLFPEQAVFEMYSRLIVCVRDCSNFDALIRYHKKDFMEIVKTALFRSLKNLLFVLAGSVTGHYVLELDGEYDRICAIRLAEINSLEIGILRRLMPAWATGEGHIFTGQQRRSNFRNETLAHKPCPLTDEFFAHGLYDHIGSGALEFDYVSTTRPASAVTAMSDFDVSSLLLARSILPLFETIQEVAPQVRPTSKSLRRRSMKGISIDSNSFLGNKFDAESCTGFRPPSQSADESGLDGSDSGLRSGTWLKKGDFSSAEAVMQDPFIGQRLKLSNKTCEIIVHEIANSKALYFVNEAIDRYVIRVVFTICTREDVSSTSSITSPRPLASVTVNPSPATAANTNTQMTESDPATPTKSLSNKKKKNEGEDKKKNSLPAPLKVPGSGDGGGVGGLGGIKKGKGATARMSPLEICCSYTSSNVAYHNDKSRNPFLKHTGKDATLFGQRVNFEDVPYTKIAPYQLDQESVADVTHLQFRLYDDIIVRGSAVYVKVSCANLCADAIEKCVGDAVERLFGGFSGVDSTSVSFLSSRVTESSHDIFVSTNMRGVINHVSLHEFRITVESLPFCANTTFKTMDQDFSHDVHDEDAGLTNRNLSAKGFMRAPFRSNRGSLKSHRSFRMIAVNGSTNNGCDNQTGEALYAIWRWKDFEVTETESPQLRRQSSMVTTQTLSNTNSTDYWSSRLRDFRLVSTRLWLTIEQAVRIAESFPDVSSTNSRNFREDVITILFGRLINIAEFRALQACLNSERHTVLRNRLGYLNILNLQHLEGSYDLDLSLKDNWFIVSLIISLKMRGNLKFVSLRYRRALHLEFIPGWEVPVTWIAEQGGRIPDEGNFICVVSFTENVDMVKPRMVKSFQKAREFYQKSLPLLCVPTCDETDAYLLDTDDVQDNNMESNPYGSDWDDINCATPMVISKRAVNKIEKVDEFEDEGEGDGEGEDQDGLDV